jgi:hypothetical protein
MIWLERRRVRNEPSGLLSRWLRRFGHRSEPSDVEIIVWRYARERANGAVASPGEREPDIDPDNLSRIEQWLEDGIPLAEIRGRISGRYPDVTDSQLARVLHR